MIRREVGLTAVGFARGRGAGVGSVVLQAARPRLFSGPVLLAALVLE